jgi:hypothetical protein
VKKDVQNLEERRHKSHNFVLFVLTQAACRIFLLEIEVRPRTRVWTFAGAARLGVRRFDAALSCPVTRRSSAPGLDRFTFDLYDPLQECLRPIVRRRRQAAALQGGLRPQNVQMPLKGAWVIHILAPPRDRAVRRVSRARNWLPKRLPPAGRQLPRALWDHKAANRRAAHVRLRRRRGPRPDRR